MAHTPLNQAGDPVEETVLFANPYWPNMDCIGQEETSMAIALLCNHLKVEIVRTNRTKHGHTEIVLREVEQ